MIMVSYLIDATALADIDKHRPDHLAHAQNYADAIRFAVTGASMDDGVLQRATFILEGNDEDLVARFVGGEPYLKAGIFTSPEVTRANVRIGALMLTPLP